MILCDTNQLFMASYFVHRKYNDTVVEESLRHLFINTLRIFRKQFTSEYGEMVLCVDASNVWRKQYFEYYKASRKAKKDSDVTHDWNVIFGLYDKFLKEVSDVFPWIQLRIDKCEADDSIAVICQQFHCDEKIMILSNDKDFMQLQRYPGIKQYGPIKKELIVCSNPKDNLLEHILKGDTSDGIPNILSDDDTFTIEGKRQKPLSRKRMISMIADGTLSSMDNWHRNQTLIDFTMIPDDIRETIIREYGNQKAHRANQLQEIKCRPGDSLYNRVIAYLSDNNLTNLMEVAEDFV